MVRPFRRRSGHDFFERAGGEGMDGQGGRPGVHGPCGASASGRPRNRSASGQAAAKARRTRLAVSMTRAAILIRRRRKVRELGPRQVARRGNGVADSEHQPIGAGVQDEAHLIGDRRPARRAIGGKLRLVQLDQVLGLTARAIKAVVKPFRRAMREIGDDEADVEAEPRRLDAGDGAALSVPGFGPVPRLGVTAHDILVVDGALGANGVRRFVHLLRQGLRAGKAEDVIHAVILAPRHRLRSRVMPVASKQDARLRPALADMPRQPAQMSANLDAGRRLAGTQHDGDGPASVGVVDMDRQEAALVVVGVEQRELLMPMHDVTGVVDVEGDGRGLAFIGVHPLVDQRIAQPDRILQRRRILQPRQRRLRTKIAARVGQPPAGELERWIGAQKIQIVGVLVAAGNGEDAGADHVGERVGDPRGITTIRKATRQSFGDAKASLRHRQQHDAAVRGQATAVEIGCDFLARDGWKRERQEIIVCHGGRGWRSCGQRVGFDTQILRHFSALSYARQPRIPAPE